MRRSPPPFAAALLSLVVGCGAPPSVTPPTEQAQDRPAEEELGPVELPTGDDRIVFTSERDGNFDIYVMNADGSDVTNLTRREEGSASYPVYSPDGELIAFTGDFEGQGVYVMNADGTGVRKVFGGDGLLENPDWSPGGTQLVFTYTDPGAQAPAVSIVDLDGSGQHVLFDQPRGSCDPAWSPDGSLIAFASCIGGNDDLYVMNADGTGVRQLTDTPLFEFQPVWSPDGGELVFARGGLGDFDLFVISVDGSDTRQIVDRPGSDQQPAWSPDGERIVFAAGTTGQGSVFVVSAEGGEPREVTPDGGGDSPSWVPSDE